MKLNRRDTLLLGGGATLAALLPIQAMADSDEVGAAIAAFTGGVAPGEGGLTIDAPEIAENGNTVPISVSAPGAAVITVFATGNPLPGVVTFNFGPLAASQSGATRIRLAQTQDLIAVAKMADGSFQQASTTVKVTIGGCGG